MNFEKKEETRDFQYVYFIENHIGTSQVKLDLSKKQTLADNLECVKINKKVGGEKDYYVYYIYRFIFYSSKAKENISKNLKEAKSYEIGIEMKDENDVYFEKKINIDDFERDIFIFDFKFDKIKGWISDKDPPKSYSFSLEEQFLIYVDFLRNGYNAI